MCIYLFHKLTYIHAILEQAHLQLYANLRGCHAKCHVDAKIFF